MNNKSAGWTLFSAALATLFLSMSADVRQLHSINEAFTPFFVGNMLGHIGEVLMAFVGGKLIPTAPQNQRIDD